MSKSQSSNVDGRCDGDEMSTRDQRGRTSPSDRVKEDVSQEYFTLSKQTYTSEWSGWRIAVVHWLTTELIFQESDELGGLAEF